MKAFTRFRVLPLAALMGLSLAGMETAQAVHVVGQPLDGLVGCDISGDCSITLDETGNISSSFNGFFGPYDIQTSNIAPTVNPAWAGLEVTSYEILGKGGIAPLNLQSGVLGIYEFGSTTLLSDALVFTDLGPQANGYGLTRIDFLSDSEGAFSPQDFSLIVNAFVTEDINGFAVYEAFSGYANGDNDERVTFFIDSSLSEIPIPAAVWLFGSGLGLMGVMRRKATA